MEDVAERRLLLTYFANSYSAYFKSDEIAHELSRLQEYVQETVVKLEELQSLFIMKESEDKEWTETIIPAILKQNKEAVKLFFERLSSLSDIVNSYKKVLNELEAQILQAEQAFGLTPSLRSVLSLFKRPADPAAMVHSLESSKFMPVSTLDMSSRFHEL